MYRLLIILVLCLLIGCTSTENSSGLYSEDNIFKLQVDSSSMLSNDFTLIDEANSIMESTSHINFALSFKPDDKYKGLINIFEEEFEFIDIDNSNLIQGTYTVNNSTDRDINITLLFMQGNKNAPIIMSENQMATGINFTTLSNSSLEIPIELKWNIEGASELIIIPIVHDSKIIEYNGKNLGITRLFVKNNDMEITEEDLKNQTFLLPDDFNPKDTYLLPFLSFIEERGDASTNTKIRGIKLPPLPYSTVYDFLLVDEFGNAKLIKQDVNIEENKKKEIIFNDQIMGDIYSTKQRQFIIMLNNRGKDMISDLKALELNRKPFVTSFIGIIEVIK